MRTAYFKYIFALLLFGSNGVVASHIELNSYEIVLLRSVLGGTVLAAIYFLMGRKWTVLQHRKDGMYIALSGIAMALDWLLLFEAYQQIGVSLGMLINYCGPVIVVALSVVLFKERMTRFKAAALMMALLGVFLISGQAAAKGVNGWGLLCAGLSALAYSAMVIFNKLSKEITGMENAVLQLSFAAVTVVVFASCKQGFTYGNCARRLAPCSMDQSAEYGGRVLLLLLLYWAVACANRSNLRLHRTAVRRSVLCGLSP